MRTKQENLELFKKYFAPYEIVSYNVWKSFTNKDEIFGFNVTFIQVNGGNRTKH